MLENETEETICTSFASFLKVKSLVAEGVRDETSTSTCVKEQEIRPSRFLLLL